METNDKRPVKEIATDLKGKIIDGKCIHGDGDYLCFDCEVATIAEVITAERRRADGLAEEVEYLKECARKRTDEINSTMFKMAENQTALESRLQEAEAAIKEKDAEIAELKIERDQERNWFQGTKLRIDYLEAQLQAQAEVIGRYREALREADVFIRGMKKIHPENFTEIAQAQEKMIQEALVLPLPDSMKMWEEKNKFFNLAIRYADSIRNISKYTSTQKLVIQDDFLEALTRLEAEGKEKA